MLRIIQYGVNKNPENSEQIKQEFKEHIQTLLEEYLLENLEKYIPEKEQFIKYVGKALYNIGYEKESVLYQCNKLRESIELYKKKHLSKEEKEIIKSMKNFLENFFLFRKRIQDSLKEDFTEKTDEFLLQNYGPDLKSLPVSKNELKNILNEIKKEDNDKKVPNDIQKELNIKSEDNQIQKELKTRLKDGNMTDETWCELMLILGDPLKQEQEKQKREEQEEHNYRQFLDDFNKQEIEKKQNEKNKEENKRIL